MLVGIEIETNSEPIELGVFLLQGDDSSNLVVTNTCVAEFLKDSLSTSTPIPFTNTECIAWEFEGKVGGVLDSLAMLPEGPTVFVAWLEAFGMALETSLLDYGRQTLLADDYDWPEVLSTSWKILADRILVA